MNLWSTIITLVSLYKLYYFFKRLHSSQVNLGINKKSLVLHVVLLCMTSILSVTSSSFTIFFNTNLSLYAYGPLLFFESVIGASLQILICYISKTLGASTKLRLFKVILIESLDGTIQVNF